MESRDFVDQLARTPISKIVLLVAVLTVLRVGTTYWLNQRDAKLRPGPYRLGRSFSELLDAFIYAGVFVFMLIRPFAVQAFVIPSGSMWPVLHVNDFIVANKAVYRYSDPKRDDVVVFHPPSTAAMVPGDLDAAGEMKSDFVKRCIGIPGDLVEMKNGILYRNGQKVEGDHGMFNECKTEQRPCQDYRVLSPDEIKELPKANFKLVNYKGRLIPLNYTDLDANSPFPLPEAGFKRVSPYEVNPPFEIDDSAEQKKAAALPAERLPAGMYLMMGDNRNDSLDGRAWGLVSRDRIIARAEFVWFPLSDLHMTR
jgi:signal peptidase I